MQHYIDILIIIGSLAGMMWVMLRFMLRDIHNDLAEIKADSKKHEQRIDHLYQICIEMLGTRHRN